jgi:hypothetical protein
MSDRDYPQELLDEYRLEDKDRGPWEEAAYFFGLAAAFGVMGMAVAIRQREAARRYREWEAARAPDHR